MSILILSIIFSIVYTETIQVQEDPKGGPRIEDPAGTFIGPPPWMSNSLNPDLYYRIGELSDGRVFFTSHVLFPGGGPPSDLTRPSNVPLRPWTSVVKTAGKWHRTSNLSVGDSTPFINPIIPSIQTPPPSPSTTTIESTSTTTLTTEEVKIAHIDSDIFKVKTTTTIAPETTTKKMGGMSSIVDSTNIFNAPKIDLPSPRFKPNFSSFGTDLIKQNTGDKFPLPPQAFIPKIPDPPLNPKRNIQYRLHDGEAGESKRKIATINFRSFFHQLFE